eukprot:c4613_g1_i1.p1 GENE.c4613_g1_i1~~c4613_g1_i1.p1  ORF type:complete len:356 (+),score=145.55 c4613_g1_i1:27-1094(+)
MKRKCFVNLLNIRRFCSSSHSSQKIAALFPGQGNTPIGIGKDLFQNNKIARQTFEEADEILGEKLSNLMFEGDQQTLQQTRNLQPAILTHSIATFRVTQSYIEENNLNQTFNFALGHSLGQFTALVATKSLSFTEAITFVRQRGEAMQESVRVVGGENEKGMMVVLFPINLESTKIICEKVKQIFNENGKNEFFVCNIANINSPTQIVISGTEKAIELAKNIAKKEFGVKKIVDLPVSAPFHCELMNHAAKILKPKIENLNLNNPIIPIISNTTATELHSSEEIREEIFRHICGSVRWLDSVSYAEKNGVSEWIEFGPGTVLSDLVKRCSKNSPNTRSIGGFEDIQNFVKQKIIK